jgi:hypothetical protein
MLPLIISVDYATGVLDSAVQQRCSVWNSLSDFNEVQLVAPALKMCSLVRNVYILFLHYDSGARQKLDTAANLINHHGRHRLFVFFLIRSCFRFL